MQPTKVIGVATVLLLATALTSCNIGKAPEPTQDVNAIFTSAAGTMIAQLNDQQTQTAQAVPPTALVSPTPFDTMTPLPTIAGLAIGTPFGTPFVLNTPGGIAVTVAPTSSGSGSTSYAVGCNNAEFVGETIPDGTIIHPGKKFSKAWQLQNTGTCTWDEGYSFQFKSGEQMQGENVYLTKQSSSSDFTPPGHSQTFVIHMWAPGTAGEYIGYWQMKDDAGNWFGSLVSVDIHVHR
jgi:hypothetical protein